MINKCSYKILPEYKLIIGCYCGEISEKEIITLKESIISDEAFNVGYNILDDYRDARFITTADSQKLSFNWFEKNFTWKKQSAVLTDTPDQVTTITLFDDLKRNKLPINIKIFSTLQASLQWVGLSARHLPEIEAVIMELKS